MQALTTSERDGLANMLRERKQMMRDEIREGLAKMRAEGHEDVLAGTPDAGDEGLAMLVTEVTNAEVARDAAELRDILAAEARIASGRYAICIDCEEPIPYARLAAYPTAKRCIGCQEIHEAARGRARPA
ncbi:MAG: TraR/DksA family transcriptional regulator [Ottowia sp.]|nr:TraR/DksA family transcriptional regulator [Ottowia sp.]